MDNTTADIESFYRVRGLPSYQRLEALAREIDAAHRGQADATAGWRTGDHRLLGLLGERHMAAVFRLPMDLRVLRRGNGRKAFTLKDGTTVDVVTRTRLKDGREPDLTRRIGRGRVGALVLVLWNGYGVAPDILGWIDEKTLLEVGARHSFRDGLENVVMPAEQLYPFHTLMRRHRPHDPLAAEPAPRPADDGRAASGQSAEPLAAAWENAPLW